MGIMYFQKYFDIGFSDDNKALWLTFLIVAHVIGILYFMFLHHLVFKKPRKQPLLAGVLSFIGTGIGQAYNLQFFRAFMFAVLNISILVYGIYEANQTGEDPEHLFVAYFVVAVISMLTASFDVHKANTKLGVNARMRENVVRSKEIASYQKQGYRFAIDTNILMHEPDLLIYLLQKNHSELYMSMVVFNELDGLKKSEDKETRTNAQLAFDVIELYQKENKLHMLKVPKNNAMHHFGLGTSPDEKIIGTYLENEKNSGAPFVFLSNDKGARIIARNVGLPLVEF